MKTNTTYYINLLSFLVLGLASCQTPASQPNESDKFKLYSQFNQHFNHLQLPYKLTTNSKNYSVFTAMLTENQHIDSTFRHIFVLDSLQHEYYSDSIAHGKQENCCKFYHIGKIFETTQYAAVLYARNNLPPQDEIYIFLATMDKQGNKIDEILFHKPMFSLPPTELQRTSEIRLDSTIHISKLIVEYEFEKNTDNMKVSHEVLYEKTYQINPQGKIELKAENKQTQK